VIGFFPLWALSIGDLIYLRFLKLNARSGCYFQRKSRSVLGFLSFIEGFHK